ncbi:hypothetical protein O4J56_21650 [Nocardiopsis sp. RSe5-2]|uniref:Uncharacterized protein n=1 Tax=Nocardiopsis endophytica TaxID=3018445 RepID=A0ABT4U8H9_9ACTN|nr:hypothetical protein [Nocardiopsis endophytica]MDA2813265.1 hypothetical protein [Nocardiopsis endophytica]
MDSATTDQVHDTGDGTDALDLNIHVFESWSASPEATMNPTTITWAVAQGHGGPAV